MKKYMEILPNIMENLGPHSINSKQVKKTKTVPDMVASSLLPGRGKLISELEVNLVYTGSFGPAKAAY